MFFHPVVPDHESNGRYSPWRHLLPSPTLFGFHFLCYCTLLPKNLPPRKTGRTRSNLGRFICIGDKSKETLNLGPLGLLNKKFSSLNFLSPLSLKGPRLAPTNENEKGSNHHPQSWPPNPDQAYLEESWGVKLLQTTQVLTSSQHWWEDLWNASHKLSCPDLPLSLPFLRPWGTEENSVSCCRLWLSSSKRKINLVWTAPPPKMSTGRNVKATGSPKVTILHVLLTFLMVY